MCIILSNINKIFTFSNYLELFTVLLMRHNILDFLKRYRIFNGYAIQFCFRSCLRKIFKNIENDVNNLFFLFL